MTLSMTSSAFVGGGEREGGGRERGGREERGIGGEGGGRERGGEKRIYLGEGGRKGICF